MPGLSERKSRLKRAARPLRPLEPPYYLSYPRSAAERAPGWYCVLEGLEDAPIYLGANHVDAEITLKELVKTRRAPA